MTLATCRREQQGEPLGWSRNIGVMGSRTRSLGSRRETSGGRFVIGVLGSLTPQVVATTRVARSFAIPWRTARACVYDVAWQSAADRTFGQRRTVAPAQ